MYGIKDISGCKFGRLTAMAERDAVMRDLAEVCEENPDASQYCKHRPCISCIETYGCCIGWEWKGLKASEGGQK